MVVAWRRVKLAGARGRAPRLRVIGKARTRAIRGRGPVLWWRGCRSRGWPVESVRRSLEGWARRRSMKDGVGRFEEEDGGWRGKVEAEEA